MRRMILKLAIAGAFVFAASQAFAHAHLEKATPPVGGTVSPPTELRLEFSEGVEPKRASVIAYPRPSSWREEPAALGATAAT